MSRTHPHLVYMGLVGHSGRRDSSIQGERPGGRYRDTLAMWPFGITSKMIS